MKIVTLGGNFDLGGDVLCICWVNENCFIQWKSCYLGVVTMSGVSSILNLVEALYNFRGAFSLCVYISVRGKCMD